MAVPFCLGKVIDVIYTTDSNKMKENLNKLSVALLGIFIIGGLCNFGRVYLMSISGTHYFENSKVAGRGRNVYASIKQMKVIKDQNIENLNNCKFKMVSFINI